MPDQRSGCLWKDLPLWDALAHAYELAGDASGQRWAEQEWMRRFPCAEATASLRHERWRKAHPDPDDSDAASREAHARALFGAAGEWIRQCPDDFQAWTDRFWSVDAAAPDALLLDVMDGFFERWEKPARHARMSLSPYLAAAKWYLDRGLRLDQVPSLARRGIEDSERRFTAIESQAGDPNENRRMALRGRLATHIRGWSLMARAEARLGQEEAARRELAAMQAALPPLAGADAGDAAFDRDLRARFWQTRAEVAAALGQRADAAAFYARLLELRPADAHAEQALLGVWKELGGSAAGLEAWRTPPAKSRAAVTEATGASAWTKLDRALPAFELVDLGGHRWSLADLQGRAVIVVLWARWCGACIPELPFLQELHKRLKERKDTLVLSMNIDDDVGIVAPFLRERGLDFPVLLAQRYISQTLDDVIIPRTWIVDRRGVIRFEQVGYGGSDIPWVDDVLKQVAALPES